MRCGPKRSEKSAFRKRDGFPVADDEVVDEAHIDERERFSEAVGDGAVGRAWLCYAAGMIVGTYDRRRVMSERPAHDDARIDGGAVQGAL